MRSIIFAGDVMQFHQNAKGFRRGRDKFAWTATSPLPLEHAAPFQAFHSRTISLPPATCCGSRTTGSPPIGKHRLNNGVAVPRKAIRRSRETSSCRTAGPSAKDFGHLDHGYVVTSHASQGEDRRRGVPRPVERNLSGVVGVSSFTFGVPGARNA